MNWLSKYALYLSWVVALLGLFLSLYFGEIQKGALCPLCWYQRISLFPLAILLGVAAYRDDRPFALYAFILVCIGELFALYQIAQRYFPFLKSSAICGYRDKCTEQVFELFGFFTFPVLSAMGFLLIAIFLLIALKKK